MQFAGVKRHRQASASTDVAGSRQQAARDPEATSQHIAIELHTV
jgi:hypothetical protein